MATYSPINQQALDPGINPADRNGMALQAGYTGWSDYLDQQRYAANANGGSGGGQAQTQTPGITPGQVDAAAAQLGPANTLNLQDSYKKLYDNSGISDVQSQSDALSKQLNDRQVARDTALAKINDNPFYSEATRMGRVAKLNDIYNNDATTLTNQQKELQNSIATKKADVEMQLNLQTKQFDINSQQAQQALSQFNTLLGMGALDKASAQDIANITRSTGLSSNIIMNAINKRNTPDVKPHVVTSTDDNGNVTVSVIDENTGKVIGQNSLGAVDKKTPQPKAEFVNSTDNSGNVTSSAFDPYTGQQINQTSLGTVGSAKKTSGGGSAGTSSAASKANDISAASAAIQLYKVIDTNNPEWQKAHQLRAAVSPSDLPKQLMIEYPGATDYIKKIYNL